MATVRSYNGAFSFTTSQLHANIKRVLHDYDNKDLKTWPFVTLAVLEKIHTYHGIPDLPTGVAYERAVTKRYEEMYTAEERAEIASMNGSFHERYPFNYDENDEPKETVHLSFAEYNKYMTKVAAAGMDELRYPESKPMKEVSKNTDRTPCRSSHCREMKREVARLQGELFDKGSQLVSSKEYLREYEAIEGLRRSAMTDAEYDLRREKRRADAAEKECMALMEEKTKLLHRIRDLERKVSSMNDLKETAKKRGRYERAGSDSEMEVDGKNKRTKSDSVL